MSKKKELFIGGEKIKMVIDSKDNKQEVKVVMEDGKEYIMRRSLFDLIVKKVRGNGKVYDAIKVYVAKKILIMMADYGLRFRDIDGVFTSAANFIYNIREEEVGKKFGVDSSGDIKLIDLLQGQNKILK